MISRRPFSALAAIACALLGAAQASAQQLWLTGPLVRPEREVSAPEYRIICEVLALGGAERDAAGILYESYRDSLAREAGELRSGLKPLFGKNAGITPEARNEKIGTLIKESRTARTQARERFVDDLRTVLTSEQEDRWRRVERYERRQSGINTTDVCGANVDMVELVIDTEVPTQVRASIDGELLRYELEFEAILAGREKQIKAEHAGGGGPVSLGPEEFHAKVDELRAMGVRLRDVNRACLRRLGPAVGEELDRTLNAEFKKRAFAPIYKRADQLPLLNSVRLFKDLAGEQETAILDLASKYEKDLAASTDRWIAAQEEAETKGLIAPRIRLGTRKFEELPALIEARAARTALDKACRERLLALLTPAQLERLPSDSRAQAREQFLTGGAFQLPTGEFIGADAETGEMVSWGGGSP